MTVRVLVSGFVQGVGYRRFVKSQALKLDLTGWVKNLLASPQGGPDNRVEAVFQSSADSGQEAREKLEKIIVICRKGPFLSEVKDILVRWENQPAENYNSFEILR
jgi:acylphosphatase